MFLHDSMVTSELRKGRRAEKKVLAWAEATAAQLMYISVISILEARFGALQKDRVDVIQGISLHRWIDHALIPNFTGRILPVDTQVANRCASLHVPHERADRDMLIAATALAHDFTLVTRNLRHMRPTGVRILNPWD